jgi:hypothetical protein
MSALVRMLGGNIVMPKIGQAFWVSSQLEVSNFDDAKMTSIHPRDWAYDARNTRSSRYVSVSPFTWLCFYLLMFQSLPSLLILVSDNGASHPNHARQPDPFCCATTAFHDISFFPKIIKLDLAVI